MKHQRKERKDCVARGSIINKYVKKAHQTVYRHIKGKHLKTKHRRNAKKDLTVQQVGCLGNKITNKHINHTQSPILLQNFTRQSPKDLFTFALVVINCGISIVFVLQKEFDQIILT